LGSLQTLAAELAITIANQSTWLAIGQALLFGVVCFAFGVGAARLTGLLASDAPAGETLGVGLGCGLLVLAAWWATVISGGRSLFTPVAVGFAVALTIGIAQRVRHGSGAGYSLSGSTQSLESTASGPAEIKPMIVAASGAALFVVAMALLYGSTMSASARDSVQPVEFMDEAFYSILGRDLAATGSESIYSTSGFADLSGLPDQTWYHWGEIWLAAAVIASFGTAAVDARNLVVLPVLLLAAAALSGTVVRRLADTSSRRAYAFGFVACLVLAPVPLIPGPYFSSSTAGLIFSITVYGLAAVAVLLGLYSMTTLRSRNATWAISTFVGTSTAMILPAHLVVAILAFVGTASVWAIRVVRSSVTGQRRPRVAPIWRRTLAIALVGVVSTIVWGFATGHAAIGNSGSPTVFPFNDVWRASILITVICSGAFLVIPIAWYLERREESLRTDLYLGTMVILAAGAVAWGLRLSEFTMFYFFYAGIAVFATPVAVVAVWSVVGRLRKAGHARVAFGLVMLCVLQLDMGLVAGLRQLQQFGPHEYAPISVDLLTAIGQLPSDARLAYACAPFEEVGFAGSRLLSIDAHTGRRVVPMCFEAESLSALVGAELSLQVPNTFFKWAPQHTLYPDASAYPSSAEVAAFLKDHGIHYIYADDRHPNSLVAGAVLIAISGDSQVLKVP